MKISVAVVAALIATTNFAFADTFKGDALVIDGDTIKVDDATIRLDGIDAAETGQTCTKVGGGQWACGEAATNRLVELVAGGVICESNKMDLYRRYLATCVNKHGINVNRALVAEGLAWAFRRYSMDYASEEDAAREKGIGIWQAVTVAPWDYRHGSWTVATEAAPNGCPIKGNISRKGEKIYHMPWSPWYAKTKIDVSKGERWFCDEAEAAAAGWRAASWY
ncbi:thermonuclease family protein [Mesorhizobium sp. SP-1A]|uniref:thermonuclease family protein n=1 Tax=Mesorhizobium sp. SP-1A TaxID=3077840 RepID=UPI0028F707BA|nr:thermonuclease family protein [Mesorhizobium sp. SP-1A]